QHAELTAWLELQIEEAQGRALRRPSNTAARSRLIGALSPPPLGRPAIRTLEAIGGLARFSRVAVGFGDESEWTAEAVLLEPAGAARRVVLLVGGLTDVGAASNQVLA